MLKLLPALFLSTLIMTGCASSAVPSTLQPPPAPREFRGVWVATVGNIDWPARPGETTEKQQKDAITILDRCVALNLNAVILQVRPSADALYKSDIEPWSYYLTGKQGKAPEPYYDPLQFWVTEAHKRGLELHAWFNPYRARAGGASYETAPSHVSKTNPGIVREFGGYQWLDPAEKGAQDRSFNVFMDVARRYDVDGLHIDDYFYPYPDYLKGADFPDDNAWKQYQQSGGKLSRADWRRESVNTLIARIYTGLKKEKKTVKFGISPFGIGHARPTGVTGFDQYEKLYADAELWLKKGWCDYYTPQIYWSTKSTSQPFVPILKFWVATNPKGRNIWPGMHTGKKEFDSAEIIEQVKATRDTPGASGSVHFSMKFLMGEKGDVLKESVYKDPAIVPASPWLDDHAPGAPKVSVNRGVAPRVSWKPDKSEAAFVWAVWIKPADGEWKFRTYPAETRSVDAVGATDVSVSAVDRSGNESKRVVVRVK